jgi:cellulose synthase/poly-beta-1,6-N-acetylglucosamine synthase-like glycosyltransferase
LETWLATILVVLNLMLLPYFGLMLATAVAAIASRRAPVTTSRPRARFLVAIPAHDEEAGIASTVRSCLHQDYPRMLFEVVVIADNCSDRTYALALREGAAVLERHDPLRRSKGYAIEYLIDRLHRSGKYDEFDAIVIIDADTSMGPGVLSGFAGLVESGQDFAQCLYTVSNPRASWRTRLMTYAFSLFNGITPLGLHALGLGASFRGNGMCLSTAGLGRVPWRSSGLVEDMEYSWAVRLAGEKVAFFPDAEVRGVMPSREGAAAEQRRRWEFGRRDVRRRMLIPLLRSDRLGVIRKLACLLEITTPTTLTVLSTYFCLVAADLAALAAFPPSYPAPVPVLLAAACGISSLAILLHAVGPFLVLGLPWDYLLILPYCPFYGIWKLLVESRGKPSQWVRTYRERPAPGSGGL